MKYLLIWTTVLKLCICQTILLATSRDIRITSTSKPKKVQIIVPDLYEARGVDYCYDDSLICWSDTSIEEIICSPFNGSQPINKATNAEKGIPSAEGLACDWLTKKLYWIDSFTKKIEVMSLKTKHRKVLFKQEIDQPRGIAVDPFSGLLFWTDWGEVPKIERSSMDGRLSSRTVIISEGVFLPYSITLDIHTKKLYWIDAKYLKIEVSDYDGKNRTILLNKGIDNPFSLTRLHDVLYWIGGDSIIYAYNYTSGGDRPIEFFHFSHSLIDIKGLDASNQPSKSTPCDINNGGCSHLCLLSSEPPGYSCVCPTGIKFINVTHCAANIDHMLLLEQRVEISQISLDTEDYTSFKIPLKGVKNAMSIDYDPVEKFFYWTDGEQNNIRIRRAKLDGSMQENVVTHDVTKLDGIAIDWIARNIYWSNYGANRIETMRLNTNHRKAIIVDDIDLPRAIAISPQHGWLYWSDWSETYPKIERTDLDGSNRLVIVKDGIKWPNGIALDIENEKLYWGDAGIDTIEVINMDGEDRRQIVTNNVPHSFGMTILDNYLYWTDWQLRTLERIDKNTGQDRQVLLEQLHDVMGIKAIDRTANPGTNPCAVNNGDCQQFCFHKPTGKIVCSCQIEYEVGPDEKSCVTPEAFLIIYHIDHLRRVSIQNDFTSDVIPVTGIKTINAIDVDINNSKLYWSDNKIKSISRAFLNGSQVEKVIEFGVNSPESLAIDWLSSNLYWADAGSKRIEVTKLNGNYRKTLFWKNLKEPRNLVLDPRVGNMFWSEWDGRIGGIFKASMDGTSKVLFISDTGRINGLTIDYSQRSLYWTQYKNDIASIEYCDSKGDNRRQIISSKVFKPMTITQHQDYLFWTNFQNSSIVRANKFNGGDNILLNSHFSEISDLRIVHSSKQNGWNDCTYNNGNCKNLCLVKPGAQDLSTDRTCACPTHYQIKNGSCYPPDDFLLYSLKNALYRLIPNTDDCPDVPLSVPGMKAVRAIEYDPVTKFIYWIDGKAQAIKRSFNNGSHATIIVSGTQDGKFFHFYDMALEPYNRLLFWTCSVSDSINVTRLSNSSLGYVYKGGAKDKPRNIVVHPEKGLLFWTDVGEKPQIVRSQLDGQNRININTDDKSVDAIAVDRALDLLFFTQGQKIFSSDLSGEKKTSLGSTYTRKIAYMAAIDAYLYYWADYVDLPLCIERIDKLTGLDRITIIDNVQVTDLIMVKSLDDNALKSHPCSSIHNHANCSYLCLVSVNDPTQATCSCPIGLKLNEDGKTCSSVPPCGKEHFMCEHSNGDCTPSVWRCDGNIDCPDGSDETNCPVCPNKFKCHNGDCIKQNAFCDGIPNCSDGSDEINCCSNEFLNLKVPYFRCISDSKCIVQSAVCDGWTHCADGSDEMNCPHVDSSSNYMMAIALLLIFICLLASAYFLYKCKKRFKRSTLTNEQDHAVLCPLAPTCRPIGTLTTGARTGSLTHSVMNGGSSTGSYNRSHITGASSSISMNNYPLNPPPSPATTILREECCCNQYSPPPPTPCSTDVCDESDTNYKTDSDVYVMYKNSENGSIKYGRGNDRYPRHRHQDRFLRYKEKRYVDYDDAMHSLYKADYVLCPPPPTPRSNSSDPPSPSSSTYFRPLPGPPPPSPTI